VVDTNSGLMGDYEREFRYCHGLVYTERGKVFDPELRTPVGTYPVDTYSVTVCPDVASGRTFLIEQDGFHLYLDAFDLHHFVSVTASQGTLIPAGGMLLARLEELASGGSATVTLTVAPTSAGQVQN